MKTTKKPRLHQPSKAEDSLELLGLCSPSGADPPPPPTLDCNLWLRVPSLFWGGDPHPCLLLQTSRLYLLSLSTFSVRVFSPLGSTIFALVLDIISPLQFPLSHANSGFFPHLLPRSRCLFLSSNAVTVVFFPEL